jgi:hypothetical protein
MKKIVDLWIQLQTIHVNNDTEDDITWKLSASGEYLVS